MSRFSDKPDPLFGRLNASVGFDRRLASHDIDGPRAHAHALHGAGVLDDDELERMQEGLAEVAASPSRPAALELLARHERCSASTYCSRAPDDLAFALLGGAEVEPVPVQHLV